ENFHLRP
nr:Antho-RPamide II=tentacle contracting inhibitory neuropeptide [Anthopleura elegantissima=sea anemones, Peptide, 7 aa] [Anthopleura elegantissima]